MKRTCNGCRALDIGKCTLGFKTESLHHSGHQLSFLNQRKPAEECPKPRTIKSFFQCFEAQQLRQ